MDAIGWALYLSALILFGLAFGSFGNVVIWRLPRGESLNSPPSHCPACDAADSLPRQRPRRVVACCSAVDVATAE